MVEVQFRLFISACLKKYYLFRLPSRLLFKSFPISSIQENVILPVLIDNCVVLSVRYMHFFCSELILITLIKQTNTTFVNLIGAFICFILCDTILSSKVCFGRMVLRLLSVDRPDL